MDFICGNAFFDLENYEEAASSYQKAVQRNEANPDYYRDFAISLAKIGNLDRAQQVVDAARERGVDSLSIQLAEGEIALAAGDTDTARADFQQVFDETEDSVLIERTALSLNSIYAAENDTNSQVFYSGTGVGKTAFGKEPGCHGGFGRGLRFPVCRIHRRRSTDLRK